MTSNEQKISANPAKRVVVLGSGYAGVHAVKKLLEEREPKDNLEVILISNSDHLLYVTMIYEVVAGNLAPSSIRQSVRTMFSKDELVFQQGEVKSVDFDNQTVMFRPKDARPNTDESVANLSISYDYLVSAIGSETEYFGTTGAREYAHPVKTLTHAKALKNKLINHFEEAALVTDEEKRRELLSIVVVGGGPTGVTLSAKIADLLNDELAQAFPDLVQFAQVTVLEGSSHVLGKIGGWFSEKGLAALKEKKCVNVMTDHFVKEVRPDGVVAGDDIIRSQCVIWAAGVRAREFDFVGQKDVVKEQHSRRVHVTQQLHTPAYENVFVAGDQAWVERPEAGPYPMRAQFAVRQGQQAAANILADIRGQQRGIFSWADKGVVVSVGEGRTYAEAFGFRFSGPLATLAYKSIYLMSTVGIRAKLRALLEWGMNIFLPRDISEL